MVRAVIGRDFTANRCRDNLLLDVVQRARPGRENRAGALAQGTSATATINSDSAGTIFSSGSGTLDYIKEQVITAPLLYVWFEPL